VTNNKHEQYSFAALHNRLRVTGQLVAETALRIGSGRESGVTGSDLPVLRARSPVHTWCLAQRRIPRAGRRAGARGRQ
jgi:hypothetical protein